MHVTRFTRILAAVLAACAALAVVTVGAEQQTTGQAAGAQILVPPENFPWACEMKVGDQDGHVLRFGSDPKEEG